MLGQFFWKYPFSANNSNTTQTPLSWALKKQSLLDPAKLDCFSQFLDKSNTFWRPKTDNKVHIHRAVNLIVNYDCNSNEGSTLSSIYVFNQIIIDFIIQHSWSNTFRFSSGNFGILVSKLDWTFLDPFGLIKMTDMNWFVLKTHAVYMRLNFDR